MVILLDDYLLNKKNFNNHVKRSKLSSIRNLSPNSQSNNSLDLKNSRNQPKINYVHNTEFSKPSPLKQEDNHSLVKSQKL